ncbi:2,3-bisphosphoglycerate-dependent phosphoglycerate mutase [Candidatus Peregrinibacteria bacterium CG10_big_fil_rev_8_21_14_0_10_42_8]|nr:MAG: 2,3-bisphosphoglycerate-dependent phosphoglycerate mutase [Candidatus Peregrinibacteria bacterium CG10_big_fil_rev_8_21_14_0_10_42_8]
MGTLIAIRHGQSQWNLENRFTGWTDIPLTERGEKDAVLAAAALKDFTFDIAFTSRLERATETLSIILKELGQTPEVVCDSALNERHYGDLQGLNKAETVEKHGEEQVQLWRRSFDTRPPHGESMADCEHRTWPFFTQYILPHLVAGKTVIVAAHGNSLRPIVKNLEGLTPEVTASLEIGLCTPYIYRFDGERVVSHEILHVEGIVTKGASLQEAKVEEGTV